MRVLLIYSIAIVGVCAVAKPARAELHPFYTGVRQMGMGGAYTGVVNDETSLLLNPAGLGRIRDTTLTAVDPELTGSVKDTSILPISKATQAFDISGLESQLQSHPDQHFYAKAQLFPSLVTTNVGFGVLANDQISASVDSATSKYNLFYRNDYASVLGYCFRFFGGVLKVGVDARLVNRTEAIVSQATGATNLSLSSIGQSGLGLGSDVGMVLTAPVQMLPALSVTVRDIGTTEYNLSRGFVMSTSQRPHWTTQTIDSGISITPIISNRIRSIFTVELQDVTNSSGQKSIIRRTHAGGEFNFTDFLFLRAGFNEGYWTAGVEFATEHFQLQAATYGEEVGDEPAKIEDRRWVVKAAFRF